MFRGISGLSRRSLTLLAVAVASLTAVFSFPSGVIRALGGWMSDKWGARAVMGPRAVGEMRARMRPVEIDLVGIRILPFVPVSGAVAQHQRFALFECDAGEFGVPGDQPR